MNKIALVIILALISLLLIAGCKKAEVKTAITTEPLDSSDALDIQPDPSADIGNETVSSLIDETSEEEVFEDTV